MYLIINIILKKIKNGIIISYENGKKMISTKSIQHMYFIYRRLLKYDTERNRKGRSKEIKGIKKFVQLQY
jgi:hypothetical protein